VQFVHWILLACDVALLVWAVVRWKRTARPHPDYAVRRDMALLLLLLLVGVIGDAIRTHFQERSPGFLIASIFLIPIGGAALFILIRLFAAYRRSHAASLPGNGAGSSKRGRRE
jgi:hypothetical protein